MSSSKQMEWAILIDFAILVMLSIDVYFTYQNYQHNLQRGQ